MLPYWATDALRPKTEQWPHLQEPKRPRPIQFPIQRVERLGREVDHSPLSSADVKNERNYTASPPIRLQAVVRDSFIYVCSITSTTQKPLRLSLQIHAIAKISTDTACLTSAGILTKTLSVTQTEKSQTSDRHTHVLDLNGI